MIAVTQDEFIEQTTTAALEEKAKSRSISAASTCCSSSSARSSGSTRSGPSPSNGAQGFTWLAFLAVVLFVPYALLTAELGCGFPTIGAFVRIIVLGFFSISVVVYAASSGAHGVSGGDFSPTWAVFIAAVPLLFFDSRAPPRAAAVPLPWGNAGVCRSSSRP